MPSQPPQSLFRAMGKEYHRARLRLIRERRPRLQPITALSRANEARADILRTTKPRKRQHLSLHSLRIIPKIMLGTADIQRQNLLCHTSQHPSPYIRSPRSKVSRRSKSSQRFKHRFNREQAEELAWSTSTFWLCLVKVTSVKSC